uniref:Uncharacterized protein n=1 Tax=Hyaloperonospora arabidopsidis (strain Emoy2) TaxID=559515 RepID=M4B2N5_HYAAE
MVGRFDWVCSEQALVLFFCLVCSTIRPSAAWHKRQRYDRSSSILVTTHTGSCRTCDAKMTNYGRRRRRVGYEESALSSRSEDAVVRALTVDVLCTKRRRARA